MTAFIERVGDGGHKGTLGSVVTSAPAPTPVPRHERRVRDSGWASSSHTPVVDRRAGPVGPAHSIIACVDVRPSAPGVLSPEQAELLWRVALLRMERCIRPGDQLCLMGGGRVAVCIGSGSHRVAPAALGRRLARALEDRLVFGDTGLGLDVTIGIGVDASAGDATGATLARAALTSLRHHDATAVSTPAYATVTWVPATFAGRSSRRLRHRALVPLSDNGPPTVGELVPLDPVRLGDVHVWDSMALSSLAVLVVDADTECDASSLVDVVAELARRTGARSMVSTATDVDAVLLDLGAHKPDVVVLALGAEGGRHDPERDPNLAWDRPARIARAIRDMGTPVIALSMGASAAALAVCVEQGAIGLFHSDLLAQELSRQANRRYANGNGNGNGNGSASTHDEPRGPGQLPPPYHALIRLTPSERRVLFHMMEGRAAAEIATTLVVSLTTVRSHIRSILRKLNVNSQLAAVALAFGTITDPDPAD